MYKNRLCGLKWILISGFLFHLPASSDRYTFKLGRHTKNVNLSNSFNPKAIKAPHYLNLQWIMLPLPTHYMGSPDTWVLCTKRGTCFCPQRNQSPAWSCWWACPFLQPTWFPNYGWCLDHPSWKVRGPSGSRDPLGSLPPAAPAH